MPRPAHNKVSEARGLDRVCRHLKRCYPDILFFTDYAAGLKNLDRNQRMAMMRQRSHDGIMDLTILAARQGYHGMVIEFKDEGVVIYNQDGTLRKQTYKRSYTTPKGVFIKTGDHLADQANVLRIAKREGYYAIWGLGDDRTIELIDKYLGGEQGGLPF